MRKDRILARAHRALLAGRLQEASTLLRLAMEVETIHYVPAG